MRTFILIVLFLFSKELSNSVPLNQETTLKTEGIFEVNLQYKYEKIYKKLSLNYTIPKDSFIILTSYINKKYPNIADTIIATILRESSFKIRALGTSGDRGLAQFTKISCMYHKINYDSLYNPIYSIDACAKRYQDIDKRGWRGNSKINAYGYYKGHNNGDTTRAVLRFNKYLRILRE